MTTNTSQQDITDQFIIANVMECMPEVDAGVEFEPSVVVGAAWGAQPIITIMTGYCEMSVWGDGQNEFSATPRCLKVLRAKQMAEEMLLLVQWYENICAAFNLYDEVL